MKRNLFPKTPGSASSAKTKALKKAIDTYGESIISYLRRMTGDYHLAQDLAQELWIKVFDSFDIDKMSKWPFLHRKAFQVFVDAMRKKGARKFEQQGGELPEVDGSSYYAQPGSEEEEQACKKRFWSEYFPTIELTEKQKEAFWLKERYGYGLVEISEKLQTPKSTVDDWIKKVKKACKDYLNQEKP